MHHLISKPNTISLAVLLLLSYPAVSLAASGGEGGSKTSQEKLEKLKRVTSHLLRGIDRRVQRLPGASFEPEGVAAALQFDPVRLTSFVRDEIRFEPYQGIRRGDRGVLMSRGGNALEKSLLLLRLLGASGFQGRLIRGRLPEDRARRLVEAFLARAPERVEPGDLSDGDFGATKVWTDLGLSPEEAERDAKELRSDEQEFWRGLWALGARQRVLLRSELRKAGVGPAERFPALRKRWEAAVSDHFWVEILDPESLRWTAFDAAFSDASRGVVYGENGIPLTRVPESLRARLQIDLVLEREVDRKIETTAILSSAVALSDVLFNPVALRIETPDKVAPAGAPPKADPEVQIYELLTRIRRFQGILEVGSKRLGSKTFDLDGRIYEVSKFGDVQTVGSGAGEGLGQADSGLRGVLKDLGGEEKGPKKEKTLLRSLTLRLRWFLPGDGWREQTRRLFEGVRDTRKPYPALIGSRVHFFVHAHPISTEFAVRMEGDRLRSFANSLAAAAEGKVRLPCHCAGQPPRLFEFALMRQAVLEKLSRAGAEGVGIFWDTPGIYLGWEGVELDPVRKRVVSAPGIDIVENGAPFVPLRDGASSQAWDKNLTAGVLDSCIEGVLLADDRRGLTADYGVLHFERARLAGRSLEVVRRPERIRALFSEFDQAWIKNHSPPGHALVVLPSRPVSHWWSVDPATGSCLARTSGGGGSAKQGAGESAIGQGTAASQTTVFSCFLSATIVGGLLFVGFFLLRKLLLQDAGPAFTIGGIALDVAFVIFDGLTCSGGGQAVSAKLARLAAKIKDLFLRSRVLKRLIGPLEKAAKLAAKKFDDALGVAKEAATKAQSARKTLAQARKTLAEAAPKLEKLNDKLGGFASQVARLANRLKNARRGTREFARLEEKLAVAKAKEAAARKARDTFAKEIDSVLKPAVDRAKGAAQTRARDLEVANAAKRAAQAARDAAKKKFDDVAEELARILDQWQGAKKIYEYLVSFFNIMKKAQRTGKP